ncbi:MAG: hypothetical protein H6Q89_2470 [Myxococcaceae bacterium]|nr:hypothetical protein [Myxococcaceae bacterium]
MAPTENERVAASQRTCTGVKEPFPSTIRSFSDIGFIEIPISSACFTSRDRSAIPVAPVATFFAVSPLALSWASSTSFSRLSSSPLTDVTGGSSSS